MSKIYKMVTRWLILSSLPIAIIFLMFSENLMALFGSQYVASSNILAILTIATFFQAVFGVAAPTLSMTGHTKLVLYNTLSVFAINLLLNSFLIPMMGPVGAAFSTLISLILISGESTGVFSSDFRFTGDKITHPHKNNVKLYRNFIPTSLLKDYQG